MTFSLIGWTIRCHFELLTDFTIASSGILVHEAAVKTSKSSRGHVPTSFRPHWDGRIKLRGSVFSSERTVGSFFY